MASIVFGKFGQAIQIFKDFLITNKWKNIELIDKLTYRMLFISAK